MSGESTSAPPRNPRVRATLLQAARDLFSESGYQNTTTLQISARADVDESTLFRHFGSKRDLFEASVVEPFSGFFDRWTQSMADYPSDASLEEGLRGWVEELYDLVRDNQGLLKSLVAAQFARDGDLEEVARRVSAQFAAGIERMQETGLGLIRTREVGGIDPAVSQAVEISMILGSVLFTDWLFPAGKRRPSRARVTNEITTMLLHGLIHREEQPEPG